MMNATQRREQLRAILAGNQCVDTAPVHDLISARIAEDLGFRTCFSTGPVAQASVTGAPNHHVVVQTAHELSEYLWRIYRVTENMSILIGAHHGYAGNALQVMHTVEDLERSGVSAFTLDDQIEPMPFGRRFESWTDYHTYVKGGEKLLLFDEAVGRIKAAVAARRDPSMIIAARTSSLRAGLPDERNAIGVEQQRERILNKAPQPKGGGPGLAEAIRRIKAYKKAGADAVHIDGAQHGGLAEIYAETQLPIFLGDEAALYDKQFLDDSGVRVACYGRMTFMAAVQSSYDTLKALREGKIADLAKTLYSPKLLELVSQVTRVPQYDQWIKEFM